MNFRSLLSNFSVAVVAQVVVLLLSVLQSLLIPKILGVEDFGLWQLFLLYISYVGFFHLGLNDGVYLIHGGETRDQIDKKSVNSQFWFGMGYQTCFAVLLFAIVLLEGLDEDRVFVMLWTAIFLLISNASNFFGFVFQAMNETKLFSFASILERLVFLFPLVILLVLQVDSFEPYVYCYALSNIVRLAYCFWHSRDFLKSGLEPVAIAARTSVASIRVGIKLMISTIAGTLILGIARFTVDAVWGLETFGQLSFALSMANFFLVFANQAAMVLFPALRQSEPKEVRGFFHTARDVIGLMMPLVYISYFPLVWLLQLWLPNYQESFQLLVFFMPICLFQGQMGITYTTYFKVKRQESLLLVINLVAVSVCSIGVFASAFLLHSVIFVLLSVLATMIGMTIFCEYRIAGEYGEKSSTISVADVVVSAAFIISAYCCDSVVSFGFCAVACVVVYVLYRKRIGDLLHSVASKWNDEQ